MRRASYNLWEREEKHIEPLHYQVLLLPHNAHVPCNMTRVGAWNIKPQIEKESSDLILSGTSNMLVLNERER